LNIKINKKMTLRNLTNESELINKINNFNLAKKEYVENIPKEIEIKKLSLIQMIEEIQADDYYIKNAADDEKQEFTDFLNELNS
tara:strand:- start:532 stop:783 length:252 start_codon:yes stop_codon:yes gene_type:complete